MKCKRQSTLMEAAQAAAKDIALNTFKMPNGRTRKHEREIRKHSFLNWWLNDDRRA